MSYLIRDAEHAVIEGAYVVDNAGQDCCDCPGLLTCPPDTFSDNFTVLLGNLSYEILDSVGGPICCSESLESVQIPINRAGTLIWNGTNFINTACGELLFSAGITCAMRDPNNCTGTVLASPTDHYWVMSIQLDFWRIPSCNIVPGPTSPSFLFTHLSAIQNDLDGPAGSYQFCLTDGLQQSGRVRILSAGAVGVA